MKRLAGALVTRSGYQSWARSGVAVSRGRCHVRGVNLQVALVRLP